MAIITANCTKYNLDGTVEKNETHSIDIEIGDRVCFIDNSYIDEAAGNQTPERSNGYPAGTQAGHLRIDGTVIRLDSVQVSYPWTFGDGTRVVELPIVVQGDDDSIIYCNPLNIVKI